MGNRNPVVPPRGEMRTQQVPQSLSHTVYIPGPAVAFEGLSWTGVPSWVCLSLRSLKHLEQ